MVPSHRHRLPRVAGPPPPTPAAPKPGPVMARAEIQSLSDRPWQRGLRLALGLVLYGVALALMVRAGLGLDPWTVLAQGVARISGLSIGVITVLLSLVVLALWVPLRQRPGLGTIANAVVVGFVLDAALALLPNVDSLAVRVPMLLVAVVGVAVSTGLYVGAGWGPGARDGLMTGIAARGVPLLVARSIIEVSVLALGWLLGGTVGVGTLLFALSIGPLVARVLPWFVVRGDPIPGHPTEPPPPS